MSFVVAGRFTNGVRFAADSQLVDRWGQRLSDIFSGALKVVILHRNMTIGFAGDIDVAKSAIRGLGIQPDTPFDLDRVIRRLQASRLDVVQYLIGTLAPPRLVSLRDGQRNEHSGDWGWIGEQAAFSLFQREFYETPNPGLSAPDHILEGSRMMRAFEAVMDRGELETVGDLRIHVLPSPDGFQYSCAVRAFAAGKQTIPSGVPTRVEFGQGPEMGSYTEAILSPLEAGIGAIGVHVAEANAGALYWPARSDQPVLIKDCNHQGFCAAVLDRFGLSLDSPTMK